MCERCVMKEILMTATKELSDLIVGISALAELSTACPDFEIDLGSLTHAYVRAIDTFEALIGAVPLLSSSHLEQAQIYFAELRKEALDA